MGSRIKLGIVLIGISWIILLIYLASSLNSWNNSQSANFTSTERYAAVPVVVAADESDLGGLVAAVSSVVRHAAYPVHFCLVVDSVETEIHLKEWFRSRPFLSRLNATIRIHSPPSHAKLHLPKLCPEALVGPGVAIYLDADVIVQADVIDLYHFHLGPRWASFADDCRSPSKRFVSATSNTYSGKVDLSHPAVSELHLQGKRCSFDVGVFVANLTLWRDLHLSEKLDNLIAANKQRPIYGAVGSEVEAAMLVVFYKQHATLNPLWNVRDLGISRSTRYSPSFLSSAKLLHWSGHFKPWGRKAPSSEVWDKYFTSDPTGKFRPIRKRNEVHI